MGFHVCEYCEQSTQNKYPRTSSGDVMLVFVSGHTWQMPDMILHYVADHGWEPPADFVEDVMRAEGNPVQAQKTPVRIGYLSGSYHRGTVPEGFIEKLELLMHEAKKLGNRIQFRGLE